MQTFIRVGILMPIIHTIFRPFPFRTSYSTSVFVNSIQIVGLVRTKVELEYQLRFTWFNQSCRGSLTRTHMF